jgi:threonine/homoserine/homoserine lactone efflux protein
MTGAMWVAVLSVLLGLGVALSPSPTAALTCANTERAGWDAGTTTALGSTVADVAIGAVAITILLGVGDRLAAFVGVVGGVLLLGLGLDALKLSRDRHPMPRVAATPNRLVRGFLLELSQPQALLFGLTTVGPVAVLLRETDGALPWAVMCLLTAALLAGRLILVRWVARTGRLPAPARYRVVCWLTGGGLSLAGLAAMVWLGSYALGR